MNNNHPPVNDAVAAWASDLRSEFVHGLPSDLIHTTAGTAAAMSFAAGVGAGLLEGGISMTTTSIGAAASVGVKAKIVAGALAATLAVGGTAAATGTLPDGAQSVAADLAANVGLTLPRPETSIELLTRAGIAADEFITVSTVGQVGVALDASGLALTGVTGSAGVTASILSETADSIIVEFVNSAEVATLIVTSVDGKIVSSISRTEFAAESDSSGTVSVGGSDSGTAETSSTPSDSSNAPGSVIVVESSTTADASVECAAPELVDELALSFDTAASAGDTSLAAGGDGSIIQEIECPDVDLSAEGTGSIGVGSDN